MEMSNKMKFIIIVSKLVLKIIATLILTIDVLYSIVVQDWILCVNALLLYLIFVDKVILKED